MSKRIDEINNKYLEIWERYHKCKNQGIIDLLAIVPMQYSAFDYFRKGVLYIGLNPSFSIDNILSIFTKAPEKGFQFSGKYDDNTLNKMFEWQGKSHLTKDQISDIKLFESAAKICYPTFFKPMQDFELKINSSWAHIDVFPIRKTNSRDLIEQLNNFPELKRDLLCVFYSLLQFLIEENSPKVIAVINAKAARSFCDCDAEFNNREFWEQYGIMIKKPDENYCHYQLLFQGNNIPLFPSGPLNNAGHIDKYSEERLFWLMKKIING